MSMSDPNQPPHNPNPSFPPGQQPGYGGYPAPMPYAGFMHGVHPLDQLLKPARRAGIFMFITAIGGLLIGGCFLAGSALVSNEQFAREPQVVSAMAQSGITLKQMQAALIVMGVIAAVVSIAIGITAFFVRKGGLAALVVGLIMTAIPLLLFALACLIALIGGEEAGICVYGPLVALLTVVVVLLIQAMTKAGQVKQWRTYLAGQAQFGGQPGYGWQAQQQGYGAAPLPYPPQAPQNYGNQNYPPPPPPPPPAP